MNRLVFLIVFLSFTSLGLSQAEQEMAPPNYIRTVKLYVENSTNNGNPIIPINGMLNLTFDDIIGDEADYYYKIQYYDYNWRPTQLSKNEYMEGLDNIRIMNYQNSYNTLQPFSHY